MQMIQPNTSAYEAAKSGTFYIRHDRGVLVGTGADRLDLLHRLSTNATRDLKPGEETSTILTSDKGRIVEILRIYALPESILMVMLGRDVGTVSAWLDKYTIMDDFVTSDATDRYAVVGIYGERARSVVAALAGSEPPNAGAFLSAAGPTGEYYIARDARIGGAGGFQVIVPAADYDALDRGLQELGAHPVDRETFEVLRVESGLPGIGHELSQSYNPLEAGLTPLISFTKGCYIGQEVIARLDTYDKVQRHLVGLAFDAEPADASAALQVESADAGKIGAVTSLVYSPRLAKPIGLAYVRTQHAVPGARVDVAAEGEESARAHAVITKLPFDV
jgi:aminomethyltransferase